MLVLSRRANQSIVIGDDIVVTVLDVRGDQVRLGIQAPRNLPENQAAAAVSADVTALLPRPPG
jgi:carbon storage regulator